MKVGPVDWLKKIIISLLIPISIEAGAHLFFPLKGLTFVESIARQLKLHLPKEANEKRIFVFGASSIVGYHHQGRSSLVDSIDFLVHRLQPETQWTVVNFGKPGEGSEMAFRSSLESIRYQPDMLVLYTGNTDFNPIPILRRQWKYRLEALFLKSKAVRVVRELFGKSPLPSIPDFHRHTWAEVDNGIANDKEAILNGFERHIQILQKNASGKSSVVYLGPVRDAMTLPQTFNDIENLEFDFSDPVTRNYLLGVIAQEEGRYRDALVIYYKVSESKPEFQQLFFRISFCLDKLGETEKARSTWIKAVQLNPIVDQTAWEARKSIKNIPGDGIFIDLPLLITNKEGAIFFGRDLVEDGGHPTVSLEYKMAQLMLDVPYVKEKLDITHSSFGIPLSAYRQGKGLDKFFDAQVFSSVGQFFGGRDEGDWWFLKALAIDPSSETIKKAYQSYLGSPEKVFLF